MTKKPPATAPATADQVIAALTETFPNMTPALQSAARFIVDNPREVGLNSMRTLASQAAVHPNAFVRLARQIGFEGYDEMRERFRDFLVTDDLGGFGDRAKWLQALAAKGGTAEVQARMAAALIENLERGILKQDAAQLERIADRILAAENVFVLGMGSAYSLAHQFWYEARMAFPNFSPVPRHGSQPVDDLAFIGPQDALIAFTFQPYRSETMEGVRLAKQRKATVIGITDSATSPLYPAVDHGLICPTSTPQFFESHAAVTGLLETLLAVLVGRAGETAQEHIRAFHRQRMEAGLYEDSPRLMAVDPLDMSRSR
ncbi:MAG: MurR/RpiR family transcriptional regulator [Alphaproteobacteria bacterium]|nr:MurR/RpiR family transcriptional regulator [Alphaproteobacteria bacterium]